MKYHEQLQHPLWQKKRLEVMEYHDFACQLCGDKENQLNVHHPFYKRGAMIWQYEVEELMCLCNKCHLNEHEIDEKIKKELCITEVSKESVYGFMLHPSKDPRSDNESYGLMCRLGIPMCTEALDWFLCEGFEYGFIKFVNSHRYKSNTYHEHMVNAFLQFIKKAKEV